MLKRLATRRRWIRLWRGPKPKPAGPCRSTPDARAALLMAMADGDGRYLLEPLPRSSSTLPADEPLDKASLLEVIAEARAALRQEPGRPLQPDLRPAQVAARLGLRRGALLAGAHAGPRRGPELHRPPPGALRRRGHRPGRSPRRLHAIAAWQAYERLGSARGRVWRWPRLVIYLGCAPKSNAAYKALQRRPTGGQGDRLLITAGTYPECADPADERPGLWQRGYAYDHDAPDAFSGQNYFPEGMARGLLPTGRARLRTRAGQAAGLLASFAERTSGHLAQETQGQCARWDAAMIGCRL